MNPEADQTRTSRRRRREDGAEGGRWISWQVEAGGAGGHARVGEGGSSVAFWEGGMGSSGLHRKLGLSRPFSSPPAEFSLRTGQRRCLRVQLGPNCSPRNPQAQNPKSCESGGSGSPGSGVSGTLFTETNKPQIKTTNHWRITRFSGGAMRKQD